MSTNYITQKGKKSHTNEVQLTEDSTNTGLSLHSVLLTYQSYLKHLSILFQQQLNFPFNFENTVKETWFQFINKTSFQKRDLSVYFSTLEKSKYIDEFNQKPNEENLENKQEPNFFDYEALFSDNFIQKTNDKIEFDSKANKKFFANAKTTFHNTPKKISKNSLSKANAPKTRRVLKNNSHFIEKNLMFSKNAKIAGNFISDYFEKVQLLTAFDCLKYEFVITNFVRALSIFFKKNTFCRREKTSDFVRRYCQFLMPENAQKIKIIFSLNQSIFYVFIYSYFFLNRTEKKSRTIEEIIVEIQNESQDLPIKAKNEMVEKLKILNSLLIFKFEEPKSTDSYFVLKNSLVVAILLFSLKMKATVFDLYSFKCHFASKLINFKEVSTIVKNEMKNNHSNINFAVLSEFINEVKVKSVLQDLYQNIGLSIDQKACCLNIFDRIIKLMTLDFKEKDFFRKRFCGFLYLIDENWFESRFRNDFFFDNILFTHIFVFTTMTIDFGINFSFLQQKLQSKIMSNLLKLEVNVYDFALKFKDISSNVERDISIKNLEMSFQTFTSFNKNGKKNMEKNHFSNKFLNDDISEAAFCKDENELLFNFQTDFIKTVETEKYFFIIQEKIKDFDYIDRFFNENVIFEQITKFLDFKPSFELFLKVC